MPDLTLFHVLAGLSGLFWTVCYILCIAKGFRDKTCCMPIEALALNFVWEIAFGLFWHPTGWADQLQTWINFTWGAFDVLILATFFLYGGTRQFRAYGAAVIAATAVIFAALMDTADLKRLHELTAFGVNVPMSAMFLRMLWNRGGPEGQSMAIAWTKFLGTFVVTVGFMIDGGYPVILACGWTCAVFDVAYIWLLRRALRSAA